MRRALEGIEGAVDLAPFCKNQIALVFAASDAPGVAKAVCDFARDNEKLIVQIGFFEKKQMSRDQVIALAAIPSREVLLAMLCGVLNAPVAGLARVIEQVRQQREQASGGEQQA
jgi:large subunit ribosomal protein L10